MVVDYMWSTATGKSSFLGRAKSVVHLMSTQGGEADNGAWGLIERIGPLYAGI
jgi:hypothetical protein